MHRGILILLLLSLIWGSSFILIKQAITYFDPISVGAWRIAISGILFAPLLYFYRKKFILSDFKYYVIVALFGSGIPAFLFPLAQQQVDSGIAGILNALTPLITMLVGVICLNQAFALQNLGAILMGLIGVILLSFPSIQSDGIDGLYYYLLILIATTCYSISVNTVDTFLKRTDPIATSAFSFTILAPFALFYLYYNQEFSSWQSSAAGVEAFSYLFVLAFFGTFLSIMIFFYLVQHTGATYGSMVAYMIPVVAVCWGLAAGEALAWREFLAMGLIILAVLLTKKST